MYALGLLTLHKLPHMCRKSSKPYKLTSDLEQKVLMNIHSDVIL